MDEDERDYDQASFEKALRELVSDPRAHDVDVTTALATQLCIQLAPEDEAEFGTAREAALWIIEGVLINIEPNWRKGKNRDAILAKINKAIWPALE